jgi:DNA-binding NarL/FixJ family response regulator
MITGLKIQVLIADDHAVLRAGLRMLVNAEPDMEVVGEACDGLETLIQAEETGPDVILLDITMPRANGLEMLPLLQKKVPNCRVLIITMHDDEGYLRQALAAGAAGYVLKRAADTELLSAIRAVHQGGTYLHREHTSILLDRHTERASQAAASQEDDYNLLSPREKEVIRLISMGYTNRQAADQLFLSVKTVETYKSRLMLKLGLNSRAELVRFALERGLIGEPHNS